MTESAPCPTEETVLTAHQEKPCPLETWRGTKDKATTTLGDGEKPNKPGLLSRLVCSFFGVIFRCGKYLIQSLTLRNVVKLFLLSLIVPIDLGRNKPTTTTRRDIYRPPVEQHFVLETAGYTPTVPNKVPYVTTQTTQPRNLFGGYYEKDKMALQQALAAIPLNVDPHKFQSAMSNSQAASADPPVSNLTEGTADEFSDLPKTICGLDDSPVEPVKTTIVIDMKLGPDPLSDVPFIQDAVTFLIGHARESQTDLEVVVLLDAAGGSVHIYGFIAEQLRRLREEPGIILTVTCDLKALSGGYMVASLASPGHLFAAPFASIGSIGVVQNAGLDLQEAFENYGIKEVQVKSGERKPRGTILGGVSEKELQHMQDSADRTYKAFKDHVRRWRGDTIANYQLVTTGDSWLGRDALELGLVDKLTTSDEYLDEQIRNGNQVLKLKFYNEKKSATFFGKGGVFATVLDWLLPPLGTDDTKIVTGQSEYTLFRFLQLLHQTLILSYKHNDATLL